MGLKIVREIRFGDGSRFYQLIYPKRIEKNEAMKYLRELAWRIKMEEMMGDGGGGEA